MHTLSDFLREALLETDSIPPVNVVDLTTTDDDTVTVTASWGGVPTTTRLRHPHGGYYAYDDVTAEVEAADTTTWDRDADPSPALYDLVSGLLPDGLEPADADVDITLPARMLATIVDEYLDGGSDVVLLWDTDTTAYGPNRDYMQWNSAVVSLARRNGPTVAGGNPAAWLEGMWAGVDFARALHLTLPLDEDLTARGLDPAFMELCTPTIVTAIDIRHGLVTRARDLIARAKTAQHQRPRAAA